MFMTSTSTSPSLSKSPKAQPRLECDGGHAGARLLDQLLEPAVAEVAEDQPRRPERVGGQLPLHLGIDAAR